MGVQKAKVQKEKKMYKQRKEEEEDEEEEEEECKKNVLWLIFIFCKLFLF